MNSRAIDMLRQYQNTLASCRGDCDDDEARTWDAIELAIGDLISATEFHAPVFCSECRKASPGQINSDGLCDECEWLLAEDES